MTIPSFETIKRWQLIEDWPHRASVDAVITSMIDKGYSFETAAVLACPSGSKGGRSSQDRSVQ
ncbi:hypothetical protein GFL82_00565 [Rhizobium laguerreae]|nr:hypothetical protein [Rhizobium laguerreae]